MSDSIVMLDCDLCFSGNLISSPGFSHLRLFAAGYLTSA